MIIIPLPIPHASGATHAHLELINYRMGYAIATLSNGANLTDTKVSVKVNISVPAGGLQEIAHSICGISPKTEIEPAPEKAAQKPKNPHPEKTGE